MSPASEEEAAAQIAQAAVAGRRLTPQGGGTRAPAPAGEPLSTARLRGITLYDPAALTLSARAGTPLAEVEEALAKEGQRLPFEPPLWGAALGLGGASTIGGIAAANASGPARIARGACRDALIGLRFIDGRGRAMAAGGRVMKNVTGLDFVKLLAGSRGALGLITEVTFKLLPAPEAARSLVLTGLSDDQAVAALSDALGSPWDVTGAAHLPAGPDGRPLTLIRVEGLEASARERAEKLRVLLASYGAAEIQEDARELWRDVRDMAGFAGLDGALWRLSLTPSDGPAAVAALRARNLDLAARYDWGGGLVWLLAPEVAGDEIRAEAAARKGHATLMRGSHALRARLGARQPLAAPLARLEAGLRARFDPKGVFAEAA